MKQIPLRNRAGETVAYALVDDGDFERLSEMKWSLDNDGYAKTTLCLGNGRYRTVRMHRWVLGVTDRRLQVDHRDTNPLNNQRGNLRLATHGQNQQNRRGAQRNSKSGVRGVHWHKRDRRWQVQIQLDGRLHTVGSFVDLEAAREAAVAFRAQHMPYSEEARREAA